MRRLTPRIAFESAALKLAMQLPESAKTRLLGPPPRVDGQTLSLDAHMAIALLRFRPSPPMSKQTVAAERQETRHKARVAGGRPIRMERVRACSVRGAIGSLGARLYVPTRATDPGPLLVYFHGGGWVVGDLDTHDSVCRFIAHHASIRVLAVDYRLAPEAAFPAAVDDATAALRDVLDRVSEFGARRDQVAVGGDSAGGNLAAVACLDLREAQGVMPSCQLLIYPATDLSSRRRSHSLFNDGYMLTVEQVDWFMDHYLPGRIGAEDPRASPLLAESLEGLPPAIIATAGFDVLRDEGEAYASRLAKAGVKTYLRRFDGLIHGFANTAGTSRDAHDAMRQLAHRLAHQIRVPYHPPKST